MEDSSLFMQWAMDTLLEEQPDPEPAVDDDRLESTFPSLQALRESSQAAEMVRELMAEEAQATNSWSSGDGDTIDNGGGAVVPAPAAARDYYGTWPPQSRSSFRRAPPPPSSNTNLPAVSWNFSTGSTLPGKDGVLEATQPAPPSLPEQPAPPPPPRRAYPKGLGALSSTAYAPDHIIAERKRREKINKRLIELSTVIPDLKKMDKASILSGAAKYVKELQQRIKAMEEAAAAAGSNATTVVLANKPCSTVPAPDESGSLSSSTSASSGPPPALPEIEARFSSSDKSAMVRIHCGSGKGVAVTVIAEVEELGLSVVHANVMPFSACTMIITITAKVEGLTLTTEEIVGRLNSALSHQRCNGTE